MGKNSKVEYQGQNASNYQNPEFDALFVRMSNMENGPERQQIIDQMIAIARRDSPWLWGLHPVAYSLHHQWYSNAKPNLMANNTLKYKRIDVLERQQLRNEWNQAYWQPVAIFILLIVLLVLINFFSWWQKQRSKGL